MANTLVSKTKDLGSSPGASATVKQHRWSGWPGAVCLDCGIEDMVEIGLGEGCDKCLVNCSCKDGCEECCFTGVLFGRCEVHVHGPCCE